MRRKPLPQSLGTAREVSVPAPVRGWNTRDSLAAMQSLFAVRMDNVFPGQSECLLRNGSATFASGMTGLVKSLYGYGAQTPANNKLFAVTDSGIYDITAGGTIGSPVQALTNGDWEAVNFTNSVGTTYLWGVNGVDTPKMYDAVGGWATPTLSGAWFSPADLNQCAIHKKRIWVVKKNSTSVGYLALDSIQGGVTEFPVGGLLRRGGYIVAISTWTVDSGTGPDDMLVMISSEGEIVVYAGSDPSSSTTWGLVGVYHVGRPMSRRCFAKLAGDVSVFVEGGVFPLSAALQSASIDSSKALTDLIQPTFATMARTYGAQTGWEVVLMPSRNALIVNIPITSGTFYQQFVMNTTTGAWCSFSGWMGHCFCVFGGKLYFGAAGGMVKKAWEPDQFGDDGEDIVGTVQQAYSALEGKGKLHKPTMIRPQLASDGTFETRWGVAADYAGSPKVNSIALREAVIGSYSTWNVAVWDEAPWSDVLIRVKTWRTVSAKVGFRHSLLLQFLAKGATVSWSATDWLVQDAKGFM